MLTFYEKAMSGLSFLSLVGFLEGQGSLHFLFQLSNQYFRRRCQVSGTDWDPELNDGHQDQDSIVWIKKAKIDMMKFNMNKRTKFIPGSLRVFHDSLLSSHLFLQPLAALITLFSVLHQHMDLVLPERFSTLRCSVHWSLPSPCVSSWRTGLCVTLSSVCCPQRISDD